MLRKLSSATFWPVSDFLNALIYLKFGEYIFRCQTDLIQMKRRNSASHLDPSFPFDIDVALSMIKVKIRLRC